MPATTISQAIVAVVSKNQATGPEDEIKDIEALRTKLGGQIVYDRLR